MSQKLKSALLLLALPVLMTGCELMSKPSVFVTDTYCRVYQPVCYSRKDTADTIGQITDNEVVFTRLCPSESAIGDRKCAALKKSAAP